MALGRSAVLVSALAAGALLATGSTYAAFSDYADVTGNQVSAGTVVIGGEGGAAPALNFTDLEAGAAPSTQTMALHYSGSIAADLWLELEPGSAAEAFCSNAGGRWSAKPGGSLLVTVGETELDYCAALGGHQFPIGTDVRPSRDLHVIVGVQLVGGSDARYSGLTGVDGLVVRALQTGGQGFSDFARGTITIGTGAIAPVIPALCTAAGLTDFDALNTLYLTESGVFNAPKQPANGRGYLIIGTDGDDIITGSNQADCIVGGGGNDHLIGGNQGDVLLGGDGDDVLNGAGGDETNGHSGGNGKDWLYGEAGDDQLYGGNGKDHLDGGDHVNGDVCVGGNAPDYVDCEPAGTAVAAPDAVARVAAVAGSDSAEGPDSASALGLVDPESHEESGGAAGKSTEQPPTQPMTTPTTAPAATIAAPTADVAVSGGPGPTPGPSTSPLSTVTATDGS
jgi:predicted ribosomally synthesized peptide with SipW-like signal peptide